MFFRFVFILYHKLTHISRRLSKNAPPATAVMSFIRLFFAPRARYIKHPPQCQIKKWTYFELFKLLLKKIAYDIIILYI